MGQHRSERQPHSRGRTAPVERLRRGRPRQTSPDAAYRQGRYELPLPGGHTAMTETMRQHFDWVDVHSMPKALPDGIVDQFLALDDMSATVADALDALGIQGCVGASTLLPTLPDERVVGRAVTLRNVPSRMDTHRAVTDGSWLMAEIHLVELAEPGDVLVISGLPGVSNMGGIVAATARRGRLAGAVVDGAVRDVAQSRRRGFPIWSRGISPETGKWRGSSVEINATIAVAGVTVEPGDL